MDPDAEGLVIKLSDGVDDYKVTLASPAELPTTTGATLYDATRENIAACQGPKTSPLRKKCGANLAKCFPWATNKGENIANVYSIEGLEKLFVEPELHDTLPSWDESTFSASNPEGVFACNLDPHSTFTDLEIIKLKATVRGDRAELKKGKAVILDVGAVEQDFTGWYRIRVAHGGPTFIFYNDEPTEILNETYVKHILARGLLRYLYATPEEIAWSNTAEAEIEEYDARRKAGSSLRNDDFLKAFLKKIIGTRHGSSNPHE